MIYEDSLWAEKIWYQDLQIPLEEIKAECLKVREEDQEGVQKSNEGGWHSQEEKFPFLEPLFEASKDLVHYAIVEMGLKSELYVEPVKSWININDTKDFNMPHAHPGSLLSSVFYVESTDMDATLNFIMPHEEVKSLYFNNYLVPNNYSSFSVKYAPIQGRMIIFPAYLQHWVSPSSTKRISIATNYKVV